MNGYKKQGSMYEMVLIEERGEGRLKIVCQANFRVGGTERRMVEGG